MVVVFTICVHRAMAPFWGVENIREIGNHEHNAAPVVGLGVLGFGFVIIGEMYTVIHVLL